MLVWLTLANIFMMCMCRESPMMLPSYSALARGTIVASEKELPHTEAHIVFGDVDVKCIAALV